MNSGVLYAVGAYLSWGLFPLYFRQLAAIPALQVVAHRTLWSLVFVTLLLLAIFVYPFLYALYISFTEWTLGQQLTPTWTGFANYVALFNDSRFLNAIYRSALFVTGAVSIELVLGFALALLFNKHLPAFGFFRTLAVRKYRTATA